MSKGKFFGFLFFLISVMLLSLSPVSAQDQAITNGIQWLRDSQSPDGYWGEETEPLPVLLLRTTNVTNTLHCLNSTDTTYQNAIGWIETQDVKDTRFLSRKIEALVNTGSDTSDSVSLLVSYQNNDGGWGGYKDYGSRPFDTTLALRALQVANYSDNLIIEEAILYLLSQQNADGGWELTKDYESSIYLTSLALLVLENHRETYNLYSQLYNGAWWLGNQQNQDGGFGKDGSTVWETALAYQALISSQLSGVSSQLVNALGYIESSQTEDGSWNGNAYETALALRALKDSGPDLTVSSEDLSFSPMVPIEGETVTITAVVRNRGGTSVENVKVVVRGQGSVVGEEIISMIEVGGEEMVSFDWVAEKGTSEFEVVVDPEGLIEERDEDNNSVYFFLTTGTRPDLTLATEDITFDPATPQVGDPEMIISANIYNRGESEANDFVVQMNINGQPLIDFDIATLLGGQVDQVQVRMEGPLPEGTYDIEVIIDSDDRVTESDETNNTASNSITIGAGGPAPEEADLTVSSEDIAFTPASPNDEETIRIEAVVKNIGQDSATLVKAQFYDGDPIKGGAFLGQAEIGLIEGQSSAALSLIGVYLLPGTHSIYVQVSTSSQEALTINNQAHRLLEVSPTPPSPPTGLTAIPGDQIIGLSWNPNPETDIAGYNLYRDGAKINTELITATTYLDRYLTNGISYTYTLTAVDENGSEGDPSAPATATPFQDLPAPPVITWPTSSGVPIEVSAAPITVSGITEPGTVVEVFSNGVPQGIDASSPSASHIWTTKDDWASGAGDKADPEKVTGIPRVTYCHSVAPETVIADGNTSTYTYAGQNGRNPLPFDIGLLFTPSKEISMIRLYKGSDHGPHDYSIQYTTDPDPEIDTGDWHDVTGLTDGNLNGRETLRGDGYTSGAQVLGDNHLSPVYGWLSLRFDPVQATGIRIHITKSSYYHHFMIYEFEVYPFVYSSPGSLALDFDAGAEVSWNSYALSGLEEGGLTNVKIRCCKTASTQDGLDSANWSDWYDDPTGSLFSLDDAQWLRTEVLLETTDPSRTPTLEELRIDYALSGGLETFRFEEVDLLEGENTITAVATKDGLSSLPSLPIVVTLRLPAPDPPKALVALPGDRAIYLNWQANVEEDLLGYNIYRDGAKVNQAPIDRITYIDRELTNGISYTYYITAVNEAGRESEPSLEVTATPSSSSLLPPVITQPTNSLNPATVTRSPVAVGGKAPKDAEVEVFVNGELAGTTLPTEIPDFKIEAENSKNKMVNCILSADGEGIALSSRRTDVALGKITWSENWWNKWVDLGQVYTIYEISVVGYIRFPRGWTDYYFTPITDVPMYTEEADWENATLSSIGEHTMSTECLVINYDGLSHHRAPFRTTYRLKEPICARHIYLSVATWGSPYIQQIEAVGNLKDSIGCVISPWIETGQGRIYEELETQQTLNGGNITYQYTTWREGERRIDLGLLYEEDPSRLTASSQDGAASLFDGKFGTNWYNPNDKTTNFWQFDLGSQRKISRIRIAGGKGSKYSILGSLDGEIWDRIAPEAEDYGIFRMLMDKGYFEEHIFILPKLIRYIKITQPDAKSLIGLELFEADWRNVLPEVTPEGGMRIRAVLERQDHQDTSPMLDSFTLLGETAFNLEGVSLKSGINTIWARSMVGQEASPLSLPIEVILDQAIAVAKITSPSDGEGVKGTVEVIGSVSSTSLEEWRLEYRLRDSFSWTRIAQSSTRATNDYLANWQTQDLADGDYELRLVVRNTDAIEKEHIIELRIENYLDISDLLVSPGPFSPGESPGEKDEVTISYHLSAPARIELKITNQDGRRVKTFGPALKDEGLNHEIWDPAGFESGTYRVIVSSSEPYVYHDLAWSKEKGVRIDAYNPYDTKGASFPEVIRLLDGRYRMYYTGGDINGAKRILSSISVDGITFEKEYGVRIENASDAEVIRLSGSAYRMYFLKGRAIHSAISSDGLNWQEEGARLSPGGAWDSWQVCNPEVVRLKDGSYRMYYTGEDNLRRRRILSATSVDGLVWEREGLRLDLSSIEGEASDGSDANLVLLPDHSFRIYFTANDSLDSSRKIRSAHSFDGLNFKIEEGLRLEAGGRYDDSFISSVNGALMDGLYRFYYTGQGDKMRILSALSPGAIEIDNILPQVSLNELLINQSLGDTVEVRGTATDQDYLGSDDNFDSYTLEYGQGIDWQTITTSEDPVVDGILGIWDISGLSDGTFTLRLAGKDKAGNVSSTTLDLEIDRAPPSTPIGLVAIPGITRVTLDWDPNTEPDLAGYNIYRDGLQINEDPIKETSYLDAGLSQRGYEYQLTAIDEAGNESPGSIGVLATPSGNPLQVPVITSPAAGLKTNSTLIMVEGNAQEGSEVAILLNGESAGTAPISLNRFSLELGLSEGKNLIKTQAREGERTSPYSGHVEVVLDTAPPAAPTNLEATSGQDVVYLSWSPNTEPDLAGYRVYRDGLLLDQISSTITGYQDIYVTGQTYTYTVMAIDDVGNESPGSNEVQAMPAIARPIIDIPTASGKPIMLTSSPITVGGRAEAGSEVEVFVKGSSQGRTTASGSSTMIEAEDPANLLTSLVVSGNGVALSEGDTEGILETDWMDMEGLNLANFMPVQKFNGGGIEHQYTTGLIGWDSRGVLTHAGPTSHYTVGYEGFRGGAYFRPTGTGYVIHTAYGKAGGGCGVRGVGNYYSHYIKKKCPVEENVAFNFKLLEKSYVGNDNPIHVKSAGISLEVKVFDMDNNQIWNRTYPIIEQRQGYMFALSKINLSEDLFRDIDISSAHEWELVFSTNSGGIAFGLEITKTPGTLFEWQTLSPPFYEEITYANPERDYIKFRSIFSRVNPGDPGSTLDKIISKRENRFSLSNVNLIEGLNHITARATLGTYVTLSSDPIEVTIDTIPPDTVTGLKATARDKMVTLSWDLNTEQDLAGYNVYRDGDTLPLSGGVLIKDTNWVDIELVNYQEYRYRITAVDEAGLESEPSNEVITTPRPELPDLTISANDLIFSNSKPTDGEMVTITAAVHNIGGLDAMEAVVELLVDTDSKIRKSVSVFANSTEKISFAWQASSGTHQIEIVLDPDGLIGEYDETNNRITVSLPPTGGDTPEPEPGPDIILTENDISFSPFSPTEGRPVTITANIHNQGNLEANDVVVEFWDGQPEEAGSTELGARSIEEIPGGGSQQVEIVWDTLGQLGRNYIYVVVDPENTIQENNENNNLTHKPIDVGSPTKPDLELSAINYQPTIPTEGDEVVIKATVKNLGAWVGETEVEFGNRSSVIGNRVIYNLGLGETKEVEIVWNTLGQAGNHTISCLVDPDNQVEELDEREHLLAQRLKEEIWPSSLDNSLIFSLQRCP